MPRYLSKELPPWHRNSKLTPIARTLRRAPAPRPPRARPPSAKTPSRHGLTAELACINGEDMNEFDATRQSFEDELKPVGPVQTLLVQRIVMAAWRLDRLRLIEGGVFQLRSFDDAREIERDYKDVTPAHPPRLSLPARRPRPQRPRPPGPLRSPHRALLLPRPPRTPAPPDRPRKQNGQTKPNHPGTRAATGLYATLRNHPITKSLNPPISELDDTLHKAHSAPLDGDTVAAVLTPKFAAAGGDLPGVEQRLVQALGPIGDQRAMG